MWKREKTWYVNLSKIASPRKVRTPGKVRTPRKVRTPGKVRTPRKVRTPGKMIFNVFRWIYQMMNPVLHRRYSSVC